MLTKFAMRSAFVATALVALGTYAFVFNVRYAWHPKPGESVLLLVVLAVACGGFILLWWLFPSIYAVLLVGIAGYLAPPVLNSRAFVAPDWGFVPFVIVSLILLVAATALRRHL